MPAPRERVLFVLPPGGMTPHFAAHLGTAYLRTLLAEAGIPTAQYLPTSNVGLSTFATYLRDRRPRVVGFTAYESNLRACRSLADSVRATLPEALILVGGPSATFSPDETLERTGADVCVRGAGESTIVDLIGAVVDAARPRSRLPALVGAIPNLAVHSPAGVFHTRRGDLSSFPGGRFMRLDDLPSPYRAGFVESTDVGLLTGRGCNQHCTYCSFATLAGRRVHYHSVDRVLDDLAALVTIAARTGQRVTRVAINDDAFTLSPARARTICEGILERGLHLSLVCETRVDRVDLALLRLMKRAGFVTIAFGVESAVPRVLRTIGKVQPPDTGDDPGFERERDYVAQVRRAVHEARRAGLEPTVSVIGGLPGETAEDFRATLAFVKSLGLSQYAHNVLALLPGTPLYDQRDRYGLAAARDPRTGLWRTGHAYDVASVAPLAGSVRALRSRREANEVTDAVCGRPRPERSCGASAWAIVVHELEPEGTLASWIARTLAVHGAVVVLGARGCDHQDRDGWLAALERSRAAWGSVSLLAPGTAAGPLASVTSFDTSGAHLFTLTSRWRRPRVHLETDERGNCHPTVWLGSVASRPPRPVRVDIAADTVPQIADACRWWTLDRRCARPGVLHVWADRRVTACWGGPALGRVGDDYEALAARGRELARPGSEPDSARSCPLRRSTDAPETVARLEVSSMLAWVLGRPKVGAPGGLRWPRRSAAAAPTPAERSRSPRRHRARRRARKRPRSVP